MENTQQKGKIILLVNKTKQLFTLLVYHTAFFSYISINILKWIV